MEFKGTKGGWEYREQIVQNGSFYRVEGESVKVCNVVTRNQGEAEANAKLITCAPEMLEMLIHCEKVFKQGGGMEYTLSDIQSLIEKATK
jgi:hypothetical protein